MKFSFVGRQNWSFLPRFLVKENSGLPNINRSQTTQDGFRWGHSLLTGVLLSMMVYSPPVFAAEVTIGNQDIRVDQEIPVNADVVESHGAYQSTFGVINLDTQEKTPLLIEVKPADRPESPAKPSTFRNSAGAPTDFVGTPGNTVSRPQASFTFKPNTNYSFYLESTYNGQPAGTVYSSDRFNLNQETQARFLGNPANLCNGGLILSWDDTGSRLVRTRAQQDRDFDDFIVRLRSQACPTAGLTPPVGAETPPEGGAIPPTVAGGPPSGGGLPPGGSPGGGTPGLGGGLVGLGALGGLVALVTSGGDDDSSGSPASPPTLVSNPPISSPGFGQPGGPPLVGGNPQPGPTPEPVPEPLTLLGSGMAIGVGVLLQRRRTRRRRA